MEGSGLFIVGASARTASPSCACTTIRQTRARPRTKADADGLEHFSPLLGGNQTSRIILPPGRYLAPLSRFLRSEVENALGQSRFRGRTSCERMAAVLLPDADNGKFADAYAQTVTYAMLWPACRGRPNWIQWTPPKRSTRTIGLLARTLELLGQPEARKELSVGFEMLQRSLEALDPHDFLKSKPDLWLYFYELFLAAYDPKLRKDYGVYYTPARWWNCRSGLPVSFWRSALARSSALPTMGRVPRPCRGYGYISGGSDEARAGKGVPSVRANLRSPHERGRWPQNMYGFEVLVGPYAVAHLRLTKALEGAINDAKEAGEPEENLGKRLNIYLADTLESPNSIPPGGLTLLTRC